MTTMTIRCDEHDKKTASKIANYYGLDLSTVTRAFWKEIIRTNSIPLSLGSHEPNDESLRAIEETKQIIKSGGTGHSYSSGKEAIKAALKD